MTKVQTKISRRNVIKSGGVLSVSPFMSYSVTATDSGYIEATTEATIPSGDYGIELRIFEDTDGDEVANLQQAIEIDDGVNTYEFDALQGEQGQGVTYWAEITLTGDGEDTPELSSLEIRLPEDSEAEPPEFEWVDDFSDGNANGWLDHQDNTPDVTTESVLGNYSLFGEVFGDDNEGAYVWVDGPLLDVREEFTIRGLVKSEQDANARTRLGIITEPGEGALLIFSEEFNKTFLGSDISQDPPEDSDNYYDTDYNNEWVYFEIFCEGGSDLLQAKVWEYNDTEPVDYEIEETFEGVSGEFIIDPGFSIETREMWLDEIQIRGEEFIPDEHENLYIDARNFVLVDDTIPYKIRYNDPQEGWQTITDTVDSIEVHDDSIIQLDTENHRIEGVGKGETYIELEHEDLISGHQISVGEITIGDIELLPPSRKFQAVFTDRTSQAIFASTFVGVFVSKLMTSYGNSKNTWISLGSAFLVILLAGFQGWVSNGIVFAALFFVILSSIIISNVRQNEVSVVNEGGFNE